MLHWWHVFKLFGVILLPSDHLCPRTESPCDVVLAGADDGSSVRVTDHLVVLVCVISCIKHRASGAVWNILESLSEYGRVVRVSFGDCTGDDLSSLGIDDHV